MRILLAFALTSAWTAAAGDQQHRSISPPAPTGLEVVWAAPTNNWPERLWVYKVFPQEFAAPVVSNILQIASLEMTNRTRVPAAFAEKDKKTLFFGNLEGTHKHLAICPTLGYIEYHDPRAQASGHSDPIMEVPDQEETTRLGLKYLRMVGIDLSQVATKAGTCEPDLHWDRETVGYIDQNTKREITLTNRCAVYFRRRIDGINVGGIALNGGVLVAFGNHSKLIEFRVYWRNLRPHELCGCISPEQIAESLRSGQLRLPGEAGQIAHTRKLTITYAVPYYDSKFGDEPENFVVPKVDMIGTAETSGGPVTLQFQAPLLRR